MKKLMILIAVVFAGVVFYMKNLPQKVKVQVAIIDTCGEQIWPLDVKLPSEDATTFSAVKLNGDYQLEIDDEVYLSYLENYNADAIRVWDDDQLSQYEDFPIVSFLKVEQVKMPKRKTRSEKQKQYAADLKKELKAEKGTIPQGRDDYRRQQKGGGYSPLKAYQAHKTVKKLIRQKKEDASSRDAGLRKWNSLGPGNVGGRIRTIAPHPNNPNIILIGTASGGIWRTTNAGSTWTNVTDFLPNMAVSKIVYNPSNVNVVYASTGESFQIGGSGGALSNSTGGAAPGVGLLKSTDGGSTWNLTPAPAFFTWIGSLALDPNNTEHVYVGVAQTDNKSWMNTQAGRLYKSLDGGDSWETIADINAIPLDIEIRSTNSDLVYIGCSTGAFRISNATSPVSDINVVNMSNQANGLPASPGRVEIDLAQNSNQRLYASIQNNNNGEVWRSSDDGITWSKRNTIDFNYLNGQGWYNNTIWVDPVNSNRVVVGGIDLWRSDNGGADFTKISDWTDDIHLQDSDFFSNQGTSIHADQHMIIEASNYSGSNRKVYIGNDGGIYSTDNITSVSENDGWIDLNNNLRITQFYGGAVSKSGDFVIGGSQDNSFVIDQAGGGSSWVVPVSGDGAFGAISHDNGNIAYANTNFNRLSKTNNGGDDWNIIARFGGTGLAGCASDPNGCVPFLSGRFEVQDNAPLISKFILDKNNQDVLIAGADRLWRNDNAGEPDDWTAIRSTNGSTFVAIETGTSSSKIWAGRADGTLERTTSSVSNWTDVGIALPNRFITDISVSPNSNNKVAVTIGGYAIDNIWLTNNEGSSWTNISLDFDMQVNTVTWHPIKENWLYIGTDFGVFASENNGTDWSIIPVEDDNEGPYNGEVSELFWSGDGSAAHPHYLYASTFGRGMWRTSYPLRDKIYVNKNYTGTSDGSITKPYKTAFDGFNAAGSGSEVIFLSSDTHNAEPASILLDRKVTITLQNGGASVLIK